MTEREQELAQRAVSPSEGQRGVERDRVVGSMDEQDILERLLAAVRVFIDKGFVTHLIGEKGVGRVVEWRIELHADGVGPIDLRELTAIGDQQRLTLYVDKVEGERIGVVAFARA